MIIGINCGHTVSGTVGCGAVGRIDESKETRAVGYPLIEMLKKLGHTVVDCTDNYAYSESANLVDICKLSNARPLDLFISLHFNAGYGRGTEVYTTNAWNIARAENILDSLVSLGFNNRGIKDGSNLYVLRHTNWPSALVEICFVDSDDVNLYKRIGAEGVAKAICYGIAGEIPRDKEELTMDQYNELKSLILGLTDKINTMTNPMIYNYIDKNMPDWAKEAVQWAVDNGIIHGTGDGLGLDDNKLWFLTVLYRFSKTR